MGCDEDGILSVDRLRAEYEGDVIMYRVIDSIPTTADGKIRYTALSAVMFILECLGIIIWKGVSLPHCNWSHIHLPAPSLRNVMATEIFTVF